MRKRLHKAWQNLLFILLIAAIVSSIIWICCLDESDNWIPTVMLGINAGYIMLIAIANDSHRIEDKKRRERKNAIRNKKDAA